METPATYVVIDDHEVVRAGTRVRLESIGWLRYRGDAASVFGGVDLIERTRPSIAIVDMNLPDGTALDLVSSCASTDTAFLVFSGSASLLQADAALTAGVAGFVLKHSSQRVMVDALEAMRDHRRYVDPSLAAELLSPRSTRQLSPREVQVLQMVAEGGQNVGIAHELGISPETVKAHVSRILDKFEADSRTHAVAKALREGVIR